MALLQGYAQLKNQDLCGCCWLWGEAAIDDVLNPSYNFDTLQIYGNKELKCILYDIWIGFQDSLYIYCLGLWTIHGTQMYWEFPLEELIYSFHVQHMQRLDSIIARGAQLCL